MGGQVYNEGSFLSLQGLMDFASVPLYKIPICQNSTFLNLWAQKVHYYAD